MHNFYEQVFEIVKLIPEGRVTSYGSIAEALGSKKSSRMVGYAMNLSHSSSTYIPAHRVVNRNGLLTGRHHFDPPESMEEKLISEGIIVNNNKIKNFELVFWNPVTELEL